MSLSAAWRVEPPRARPGRSLASRGSSAATGGRVAWRHPKAAAAASPGCRPSALEVVCARKPMRLSNNKKKAKQEAAKRGKGKTGGAGRDDDGSMSPQQRVDAANHSARRWLGQHFLIDHLVILDAVAAADVKRGDRILEIGPGTGNLTVELLRAGATIDAVEKDRSLADKLEEQFSNEDALVVHRADFLKWDVSGAFRDVSEGHSEGDSVADTRAKAADPRFVDSRAKVVANIPYNITTDILKTLLPMGDTFGNMVFMFQEEVARRLIKDEAGNSDYRPMSVRVHYYSTPYYIRPVTAACFDPPRTSSRASSGSARGVRRSTFRSTARSASSSPSCRRASRRSARCSKTTSRRCATRRPSPQRTRRWESRRSARAQELTMPEYVRLFNFVRDRGQAKAEALAAGQNARAAPAGDDEESENSRKPTKKQRETSRKVQRATSRLLAQAVEGKGQ